MLDTRHQSVFTNYIGHVIYIHFNLSNLQLLYGMLTYKESTDSLISDCKVVWKYLEAYYMCNNNISKQAGHTITCLLIFLGTDLQ